MKVLVVSLLRIGDLMLQAPAIKHLSKTNEVHVLINNSSLVATSLMPYVTKWHVFDRKLFQDMLGSVEFGLFSAVKRLKKATLDLNNEYFDTVINLTHNKLSAHWMGLLRASSKQGLIYQEGKFFVTNKWLRYLNETKKTELHLADIFRLAVGEAVSFTENQLPLDFSAGAKNSSRFQIVVQSLTSDIKKNWGLISYSELIQKLHRPGRKFIVLAAPEEVSLLMQFAAELSERGVDVELAPVDLRQALKIISESHLLVSGDTSIKHLASASDTPIVELSMGSSHYWETGVYSSGNLILQSKATCAPCNHSESCQRPLHVCGQLMDPEEVSVIIEKWILNKFNKMEVCSHTMDILFTERDSNNLWMTESKKFLFKETNLKNIESAWRSE